MKYFSLTDGKIELHDDKLFIFDKAKQDKNSIILTVLTMLLIGISFTLTGAERKDLFRLILGSTSLITSVLSFIKWFREFKNIEKQIHLTDIKKVKFSITKFDRTRIAQIVTKDNRIRRIKLGQKDNQDFKDFLKEHNIEFKE